MAGVLQGLSPSGRIRVTVVADSAATDPAYKFRTMGFDANDRLLITTDTPTLEDVSWAGHLPVNPKGMVYAGEGVPTRFYTGATPVTSGSLVALDYSGAITHYTNGVPYTATNAIAATTL
jgi:hypothetical protein